MATAIEPINPALTGLYRGIPPLSPVRTFGTPEASLSAPPQAPVAAAEPPALARAPFSPSLLQTPRAYAPDFQANLSALQDSIAAVRGRALLSPRAAASGAGYAPAPPAEAALSGTIERITAVLNQANALRVLEKAALDRASLEEGGIGGMTIERMLVDTRI